MRIVILSRQASLYSTRVLAEAARRRAAAHGLDDAGAGLRGGRLVECSLRWIYHHMIEEYARRNGRAYLIRELIDGTAGS